MPRTYVKKQNKRRTHGHSVHGNLLAAARDVKTGKRSYRKAAEYHNVKKSTLVDFIRDGFKEKKLGRETFFTENEERALAKLIDEVAEWGFPLRRLEIRIIAGDLLRAKNIKLTTRDGNPGKDWFIGFVKRNKLSKRAASNMKRCRSQVDASVVNEFFDELEKLFLRMNVRPENIYNYDETNFTNDPGKSLVFCRRGRKRVENVRDSSKQAFSVMWCGNATGELLPPMVVYKAKNVYEGWTWNGPKDAVYASTESGWFDSETFKTWFVQCFLPAVESKEGPIVLLGDNLGSHFSAELVALAKQKNVHFVMLIANATNWLQVLDVSVFAPMKRAWRTILSNWRTEMRRTGDIPKTVFPSLLARLDSKIRETVSKNLISGFRSTGICPLNREVALQKLPGGKKELSKDDSDSSINETLIGLLKENRGCSDEQKAKRGKKIPKKNLGLKVTVAGRALQLEDAPLDDDNNPFSQIILNNEVQQTSSSNSNIIGRGRGFGIRANNSNNNNITNNINYSNINDDCFLCKDASPEQKGDDDDYWIRCTTCQRIYHDNCLLAQIGEVGTCIYCGFDESGDESESESEEEYESDMDLDVEN